MTRPETPFEQAVGASEVRREAWKAALEKHQGVIARAAREFDFSRQRGWALTEELGLVEFRKGLREAARRAVKEGKK